MRSRISLRNLIIISAIILTIINSVYLLRPSALLKRSLLRRRLLRMPVPVNGTLRPKRQLFREDIPHHRPLSGNTYYLHAGFPHPSRWHEGPQLIHPNPNPITHHHHHQHNNNLHQVDPHDHGHHHEHQQNHQHHEHDGPGSPLGFSFINSENPHSVTIQSAIVHSSGDGVIVDNSLGNHPPPPSPPREQANFDPIHIPHSPPPPSHPGLGHIRHSSRKPKRPKPHSDPEQYDSGPNFGGGPAALHAAGPSDLYGPPKYQHRPQPTRKPPVYAPAPTRKPKTVIHYHPVSVGNIINFNDDNKPVLLKPHPTYAHTHSSSYGPPKHIPGVPLAHKDVMFSMAEPFVKTPFKSVAGPPEFLDFNKLNANQYGPPGHEPGPPLNSLGLAPMLPSYGPPLKPVDDIPPYGVALPVLAHFHSGGHPPPPHRPHHRPPKRYRGRHQQHHHFHHIHHAPPRIPHPSPFFDVKYPTYIVHGHVPHKYLVHHPHFSRRALLKSFWSI